MLSAVLAWIAFLGSLATANAQCLPASLLQEKVIDCDKNYLVSYSASKCVLSLKQKSQTLGLKTRKITAINHQSINPKDQHATLSNNESNLFTSKIQLEKLHKRAALIEVELQRYQNLMRWPFTWPEDSLLPDSLLQAAELFSSEACFRADWDKLQFEIQEVQSLKKQIQFALQSNEALRKGTEQSEFHLIQAAGADMLQASAEKHLSGFNAKESKITARTTAKRSKR